jgi:hypothetical protein
MFIKQVPLDDVSMLEVASRLTNGTESFILSIRGKKSAQEITVTSAELSDSEIDLLIEALVEAKAYKANK